MKGVAVALMLAAAASQQADGFLLAKLPASKAQQGWLKRSSPQHQGRYVLLVVGLVVGLCPTPMTYDVRKLLRYPTPTQLHPTQPHRPSTTPPQRLSMDPNALASVAPRGASAGLLATVLASTSLASANVVKALPLVGGLVALALLAIKLPGMVARGAFILVALVDGIYIYIH